MKTFLRLLVLVALVGLSIAPALAQGPKAGPPPEHEQMARMMTMMGEMWEQMQRMQEQMKGMQGTGPMPDRMGGMIDMMKQMNSMMQQHRTEMQKVCPGVAAQLPPKTGG
jgi:hypothetical protein